MTIARLAWWTATVAVALAVAPRIDPLIDHGGDAAVPLGVCIGAILFATLPTRSPVLTIPYATLVACWGLLGLFFEYVDTDLYGWSSAALVLFCASALAWLAFGPEEAQPPGAAP